MHQLKMGLQLLIGGGEVVVNQNTAPPEPLSEASCSCRMSGDQELEENICSGYPYQPLQHGKHIRLLIFESYSPASASARDDPTSDQFVIYATLQNFELRRHWYSSSPQPYRALSYEWGPPPEEDTDLPTINLDGHKVRVRRNLHDALKAIIGASFNKRGDLPMPLWVDALCINQSDDKEKGHQVELMRDIFGAAEMVLVWLGAEGEHIGTAEKVVNDCFDRARPSEEFSECTDRNSVSTREQSVESVDERYRQPARKKAYSGMVNALLEYAKALMGGASRRDLPRPSSELSSLYSLGYPAQLLVGRLITLFGRLFQASYWRRVWIIQEFVVARDYVIMFGEDHLTKIKFERALKELTRTQAESHYREFDVGKILETPAHQMIDLGKVRKKRKTTLEMWIDMCLENEYGATDPRDYVYALLGISDDCTGMIMPDYTRSVRDVYFLAIEAMRRISNSDQEMARRCEQFAGLMGLPKEDAFKAWAGLARLPGFRRR